MRLTLALAGTGAVVMAALMAATIGPGNAPIAVAVLTTLLLWVLTSAMLRRGIRSRPEDTFGAANTVTTFRAGMAVALAGLVPVAAALDTTGLWGVTGLAFVALALDGVDGWLARRRDESSDFGARFDMETDAFLGLVITLLLWRSGEVGVWVIALGSLRYAFLAAGQALPALQGELFPSFRRKLVCVIQVGALASCLMPIIEPPLSSALLLIALVAVLGSFARDTLWLLRAA